ncbi:MAG: CHAT domain-containing tetratricopeptide repeat protein [Pseudomonadota bacterium]
MRPQLIIIGLAALYGHLASAAHPSTSFDDASTITLDVRVSQTSILVIEAHNAEIELELDGHRTNYSRDIPEIEWRLVSPESQLIYVHRKDRREKAHVTTHVLTITEAELEILRGLVKDEDSTTNPDEAVRLSNVLRKSGNLLNKDIHTLLLLRLASLGQQNAQPALSQTAMQQALTLGAQPRWRRGIQVRLGTAYVENGQPDLARAAFCAVVAQTDAQCRPQALQSNSDEAVIRAATHLGFLHHRQGLLERARNWYLSALRQVRSPAQRAILQNNLGGLQFQKGNYPQALAYFEQTRAYFGRTDDPHNTSSAENNIAEVYRLTGRFDEAITLFNQSYKQAIAQESPRTQARALQRIGMTYASMGAHNRSAGYLRRALDVSQRHNLRIEGDLQLQLGQTARQTGDRQQAIEHLQKAITLYESSNAQPKLLLALWEAAEAAADAQAQNLTSRGLSIARKIEDERMLARFNLQHAKRFLPPDQASMESALESLMAIGDTYGVVDALVHLGRQAAREDRTDADRWFRRAIEFVDATRQGVTNQSLRARLTGEFIDPFDAYIDHLVERGETAAALELAASSKARSLLESIIENTESEQSMPGTIRALRNQLTQKIDAQAKLARRWPDSPELTTLNAQVLDLRTELTAMEREYRAQRRDITHDLTIAQMRDMLPTATDLIVHHIGSERSWRWVLSKSRLTVDALPGRSDLAAEVDQFLTTVQHGRRIPTTPDTIATLTPVVTPNESVFVVPDGPTAKLPYGLLYLDRGVTSTIVPSVGLLADLRPHSRSAMAAVFSDAVFAPDDAAILPRLAGSAREGVVVATHLEAAGYTVDHATGLDNSKENFARLASRATDVLHIATHGIVDLLNPDNSGLEFSAIDAQGNATLSYLSVDEIQAMVLKTRLVVLSACDSINGQEVAGEGTLSLARAFLLAGADQVVASLWPVPDRAASVLMDIFYEHYAAGATAPEALSAAQNALARSGQWRNPRNWAGFVIMSGKLT